MRHTRQELRFADKLRHAEAYLVSVGADELAVNIVTAARMMMLHKLEHCTVLQAARLWTSLSKEGK